LLSADEDPIKEHLNKLDIHKSMGPGGMHPWVLRELADVNRRLLSTVFERSWGSEDVLDDSKKAKVLFSRRSIQ